MLPRQYQQLTRMKTTENRGYKKGDTDFAKAYNEGLDEETRILCFLNRLPGMAVLATEEIHDQFNDIDCYLNGVPTSIKTEHAGTRYGHIYVELATQRFQPFDWEESESEMMSKLLKQYFIKKRNDKAYRPSWWFKGKAEQYLILQGEILYLIRKSTIAEMLEKGQIARVLGLSAKTLLQQGNKDTICAFFNISEVEKVAEWQLPNPTARPKPLKAIA